MTINSTELFCLGFGIASAMLIFALACIWACLAYLKNKADNESEEDDKFEYLVETQACTKGETIPELLNNRGKSGWELVTMYGDRFIFIRPLKDKKS